MATRPEFVFLNCLRSSGTVNMFGATACLQEQFYINRKEASKILMEWMQWVNEDPINIVIGPSGWPTLKP